MLPGFMSWLFISPTFFFFLQYLFLSKIFNFQKFYYIFTSPSISFLYSDSDLFLFLCPLF